MKWFIAHLSTLSPMGAYAWLGGILLLCGLRAANLPEDISLIVAGYFSWRGALQVSKAFLVCFAAVLAGDSLAFFLGRYFGRWVLASRLARKYFTHRRQIKVRAYFRKFGSKVVLIGRFTPGLRFTIFFTAGTLHLRPPVFLIYDFSAAAFTVPILVYTAWFFGGEIDRVIRYARHTEHGIVVAVIIGAVVIGIRAYKRHRKIMEARIAYPRRPERGTSPPPALAGSCNARCPGPRPGRRRGCRPRSGSGTAGPGSPAPRDRSGR